MKSAILCLGAVLLTGCGATDEQLRARAAFDMKCPRDELRFTDIDDRTRGVRGCGQQATYVETCGSGMEECTWVMNAERPKRTDDE